jgi:hypothetical protein
MRVIKPTVQIEPVTAVRDTSGCSALTIPDETNNDRGEHQDLRTNRLHRRKHAQHYKTGGHGQWRNVNDSGFLEGCDAFSGEYNG